MQSSQRQARILFVDFAPSHGGSIRSLSQILRHLPADRYQAYTLLSPTVATLDEIASLRLPGFTYDAQQGVWLEDSIATRQLRRQSLGRLRSGHVTGVVWRWASIGRRLWARSWHTANAIGKIIIENNIDLVHLNDALPLAEPGILAAFRRRRPSVITVRSFNPLDPFHILISRLPAAGIYTSRPLQIDQHAQGVRFRREEVIFNAIDLHDYAMTPDRSGVRAELGLPADAKLVMVVGRIMERKGIDIFIQALAAVITADPTVHGVIVGKVEITDTGLDDTLRALSQSLGIDSHIHFLGHRPDVPRLLCAADLLSFVPTLPEPFGRVVVEAMAAGLPVVGARHGAIPDILVDGETGLLVPASDVQAQAVAMQRMVSDPTRAKMMGEAGRQRAVSHFHIEKQVTQICDLYDQILGFNPKP